MRKYYIVLIVMFVAFASVSFAENVEVGGDSKASVEELQKRISKLEAIVNDYEVNEAELELFEDKMIEIEEFMSDNNMQSLISFYREQNSTVKEDYDLAINRMSLVLAAATGLITVFTVVGGIVVPLWRKSQDDKKTTKIENDQRELTEIIEQSSNEINNAVEKIEKDQKDLKKTVDEMIKLTKDAEKSAKKAKISSLVSEVYSLYERKKFDEALEIIIEAEKDDDENFELRLLKGSIFNSLERYDDAVDAYKNAIEVTPKLKIKSVYNNLAASLINLKKYQEGLVYLEKAEELDARYYQALNNKGVCFTRLGEYDKAEAYFKKSLSINSKDASTLFNYSCLLSILGRIDEALDKLEQSLRLEGCSKEDCLSDGDFENVKLDERFDRLVNSYCS